MSKQLEDRYRKLTGWYPKAWRADNEDELLGVLLESALPGQTRPTRSDRFDLLRGAAVLRYRAVLNEPVRSDFRASISLAGTIGLAMMSGFAILYAIAVTTPWFLHEYQRIRIDPQMIGLPLLLAWPTAMWLLTTKWVRQGQHLLKAAYGLGLLAFAARALADQSLAPLGQVFMLVSCGALVVACLDKTVTVDSTLPRYSLLAVAGFFALFLAEFVIVSEVIKVERADTSGDAMLIATVAMSVVFLPMLLAAGFFRPRYLMTAGLLAIPIIFSGLGQALDEVTTVDDPRPGPAIAEAAPAALIVLIQSLIPFVVLIALGIIVTHVRAKKELSHERRN